MADTRVNINVKDKNKSTPLHLAAALGNMDCLKMLLDRDDLKKGARDVQGSTAIHLAARMACEECLKLLLEHRDVGLSRGFSIVSQASQEDQSIIASFANLSKVSCFICNRRCKRDDIHVFLPCLHGTFCGGCSQDVVKLDKNCPKCHCLVTGCNKIYLD